MGHFVIADVPRWCSGSSVGRARSRPLQCGGINRSPLRFWSHFLILAAIPFLASSSGSRSLAQVIWRRRRRRCLHLSCAVVCALQRRRRRRTKEREKTSNFGRATVSALEGRPHPAAAAAATFSRFKFARARNQSAQDAVKVRFFARFIQHAACNDGSADGAGNTCPQFFALTS